MSQLPDGGEDIDQDGGQYYSPVYADHIVNYLKVSQLPEGGGGGGHRPGRGSVLSPVYADHIVNYLKVSQLPEGWGGT